MKVYKYGPLTGSYQVFTMPKNAQLVHFALQGDDAYVWVLVDIYWKDVQRAVQYFGTGHDIPKGAKYVGTTFDGPFVWHLFDLGEVG